MAGVEVAEERETFVNQFLAHVVPPMFRIGCGDMPELAWLSTTSRFLTNQKFGPKVPFKASEAPEILDRFDTTSRASETCGRKCSCSNTYKLGAETLAMGVSCRS